MTTFAVLVTIVAWICAFRRPQGVLGALLILVLLVLGFGFLVLGGLGYWWDRSMRPDQANLAVPVCGALILLSQARVLLLGIVESYGTDIGLPAERRRRSRDD